MSIIPSLPVILQNGTTADATQVMANFNAIVSFVNANAAASGVNSDITNLTGLTVALTVSQGGTGQQVLTANSVLIGEGTNGVNTVGPGTAGQVLTSNGNGVDPSFQALPTLGTMASQNANAVAITGGTISNVVLAGVTGNFLKNIAVQKFTSGGTYTPTAGMSYCIVEMTGGGGKGGGASGNASGGGGSGAYIKALLTAAQVGASQNITVGAASTGSGGGTTSVGSLLSCTGGADGSTGTSNLETGGAGGTATVSTGSAILAINGQTGGNGQRGNSDQFDTGGQGGSTPLGFGGASYTASSGSLGNGSNGSGYGSGGGGATNSGTPGTAGAGYVVIVEFCTQ